MSTMMVQDGLKELLMSYTWREKFNIWIFRETAILIKIFTSPGVTQYLPYNLERSFKQEFILKTMNENFGEFYLKVNYENRLPKLLLFSRTIKAKRYQLEAFISFSKEQRLAIENVINNLKGDFITKENELQRRIFYLKKTLKSERKTLIKEYESFLIRVKTEIEMLDLIISSTIEAAGDFEIYLKALQTDVKKLRDSIQKIQIETDSDA